MYIKDGICYAGQPEPVIKIVCVKPLRGGMLLVEFNNGEKF